MSSGDNSTVRLVFPLWQGGVLPAYQFGSELLEWLSPATSMPVICVPVPKFEGDFTKDVKEVEEDGLVFKPELLTQLTAARDELEKNKPAKIVTLGGDCLVSLAPFAYLSEKYGEDFGILWIDTHPDVSQPGQFNHVHAHVLGNLMGHGDNDIVSKLVAKPTGSSNVMIAGIHDPLDYEQEFLTKYNISTCSAKEVQAGAKSVFQWIHDRNIKKLAIHIDLDVLNEAKFHSLYFSRPNVPENAFDGIAQGELSMLNVINLVNQVKKDCAIVGITIAEYLPWDAINLKTMLQKLPLIGDDSN
ncbi:hypothetical protein KAFR_0J00100 [Kazachstania africana CBS 2517]|uniref:Arginase n=1 Tax=Kazachstania africana (strain ATCC 22294 / BCRC 22015 / CBS 2517 / CECT 1963 / NBRC 1671 / NRRL Y-8276) TaxID=1071382 RepID=H2B0C8_KAZAF|nr:hypothetical protein KAFR_0J00100 [Kazachstania africana CBS 2517]CCF60078.1 hypothetical protein KAFR_0J00100 [Kazachstania africana CBS 2517]